MKKVDHVILSGATKLRSRRISTYLFISVFVAFLAACGDSSSALAENNESTTLSSAEEQGISSGVTLSGASAESKGSCSSEQKVMSSSSAKQPETSSSADKELSSSSAESSSSSFVMPVACKAEAKDDCEYGELKDERDGKTYKTVKFGNQWWMAENLNYADSAKTTSLKGKSWCYGDEPENCAKYGRLYTWAAAIDSVALATDSENPQDCGYMRSSKNILPDVVHGICPDGWHLPDYRDFSKMLVDVGGYSIAGTLLKSQSGWNEGGNGTDAFGFKVLPAGIRFGDGAFEGIGYGTDFWSATESDLEQAFSLYASYEYEYSGVMDYGKNYAFSIRCVKD